MQTVYLSARHVQKQYGRTMALQDGSLELRQGEILALLGPNGAGKTTLIKILATVLMKDAGQVEILGYDLDRNVQEIRHLFGYVGQDTERSAYARLTVVENLHFFGALRGMSKREIDQQIEKLAAYFDFHDSLGKQFTQLSGGQKQTVVIMRGLLHNPPLIYLDEPTKGLDPIVAKKIRVFLKQFVQQERKSLLLTSHVLSEVDELADRVALIHRGKVSAASTPDDLKAAVGAAESIEIEKAALPPATRARIEQLEMVQFAQERNGHWVAFGVNNAMLGAEAIIRVLREDNVHARFRHHTVSLEDAFVHHIGELSEKFDQ
ncbi:MAG TPA: ABC transporter ATP-binding protein [Anaerolineae bacterium]|nr:ABC transporter ATP-binding protein [Anaerolineae bacterium]